MQPIIQAHELARNYQLGEIEVAALRGVSFDISAGEFVAIVGPSGSGKSTLMNLLGCLDTASSGTYMLDGIAVSELDRNQMAAVRNRRIGFIFQQFNLLPRQSAQANVILPLVYSGQFDKQERERRAAQSLAAVDLSDRAHHRPSELSGGQQQRVAIARALVTNPAILLADEPTGNLDSKASSEVMELFTSLNQQGITVIVVTHDPEVAAHSRRTITIRDGLLAADERKV